MICIWHLCSKSLIGQQKKFCGKKCKSKFFVTKWRKDLKQRAIIYKGGKCVQCGYCKCSRALQFHHIDPTKKDFAISVEGDTRSWGEIQRELDKCVLVCSNCHAEIHANIFLSSTMVVASAC